MPASRRINDDCRQAVYFRLRWVSCQLRSDFIVFEILVDFVVFVLEDFLFGLFLRGEEFGRVVEFGENLVVEVEIFVPDVGQRAPRQQIR